MTDRASLEADLRAASDGFLLLIEELRLRERRKRQLDADDPSFAGLAQEIREVAEELLRASRRQEELAFQARDFAQTGEQDLPSIASMAEPEELAAILAEWRVIERDLAAAEPGSLDAAALVRRFVEMRERYARAHAARTHRQR